MSLLPIMLTALACATSPAAESAPGASSPAKPGPAGPRIVAIGDLHGDLTATKAVFELAGLTDAAGHWVGGDTHLVQTGDVVDRGPESKDVIAFIRQLEAETKAGPGKVTALLGNHEAMNLTGDWRYVSKADIAQYGGADARIAAWSPGGVDASWALDHGVVAIVGGVVFTHGGVTPPAAQLGVTGLNEAAKLALSQRPPDGGAAVLGTDGPLWYRGYVEDPEAVACPALQRALDAFGADRMVVGHTTRRDGRIQSRCEGRLIVIDVGISAHYGSHTAALELKDGHAVAIYPGERVALPDPPPRSAP